MLAPRRYQADITHVRRWIDKPPEDHEDWAHWVPGKALGTYWSPLDEWLDDVTMHLDGAKPGPWDEIAALNADGEMGRGWYKTDGKWLWSVGR